jgi:hypothetical protein
MSQKSACFNDETFSGKKQNSWSWEYSAQVLDYQDFLINPLKTKRVRFI